jgi:TonB-linked SusC/RagA family outer membrane protein
MASARRFLLWLPLLLASALAPAQAQRLAAARTASIVRFSSDVAADLEGVPLMLRQPVTLRLRSVTIERALQEVMSQANLTLTYSRSVVPLERVVSVSVDNESVVEALRQVLGGTGVELWISAEGRMALVPEQRPTRERTPAFVGTIAGRVTTESGEPLPAVTVSVTGTRLGSSTGPDGRYTIGNVPAGQHQVRAIRIGFGADTQTVNVVDGQTVTADFTLRPLALQLGEVVSIGYGTVERRELTGAISTVSSEDLETAPIRSVDEALLGRAPGVTVVTSGGQPGGNAMVRIRGGNSIAASNAPLYVVDGVPIAANASSTANSGVNTGTLMTQGAGGLNPVAGLNPDDIESIDILKDASATSIYGARAANGVVLITTKRGRAGRNNVTFGTYYGRQEVRRTLPLLNATQFATMVNSAYTNAGQPAPFTPAEIAALGAGTNWQDEIFRSAPVQNYDLAFSGGDQDTKYYISGNLLKADGVVIGTNMDRGAFRLNLDQDVSSKFRIGNRLTMSRDKGQVLPHGGGGQEVSSVVLNAMLAPPTLPVRTAAGEFFSDVNPLTGRPFQNPVATALLITNNEEQNRIIGNGFAEYDLIEGLTLRTTLGIDYITSTQNFYSPSNTLPGRNFSGTGSRGTAQTTNWLNENTINFAREFGALHDVDLLGGVTFQKTNATNVSGTSQGFLTDRLRENGLNTATTFVGVFTGSPHSSLLSYFARANYGFADKYLFTVTGRRDGSSKFGTGNQYGFFPSAAFAWRLSEEGFIQRLGYFDDLKLRTSYGRTGNQDIGNYASLATLGSTVYSFNGVRSTGFVPASLANPDLKWETTDQTDIGIDLALLENRLALTADWYNKKTRDLLLNVPVPRTSGFSSSLQNIGSVRNRGFELGINTVNFTGTLGWTSSLNLAWNRNKVLSLGPSDEIIGLGGVGAGANQDPTILRVGEPINSFYGWVFAGLDATGQPTYADLNGDGDVTAADKRIIGSAEADYTGGFTNRFNYRNFDLTVFLQFSVGNDIYNINRALLTSTAGNANQLTDVLNAGTGSVPTPKVGNTFDSSPSSLFVEDGTYLRGKNIRLGYNVPTAWLGRTGLRSANSLQLYVSAQNFFTKTDYTGYDPEITEYALSNLAQGFDFGTYPQPRQITFGFNAGF